MLTYLKYIVLVLAILFSVSRNLTAQLIFYQNMHHGGVTGGGYTSWTSNTSGFFDIYIEPNSTIKQAFLFASMYEEAEDKTILLNGNGVLLSANNRVGNTFTYVRNSTVTFTISTVVADVTDIITPSTSQIEIVPPQNQSPNAIDIYSSYYLIVIYENENMEKINHIISINEKNTSGIVNYHFDYLNTIDTTKNVGICLHTEHHCNQFNDGSFVKINSDSIGLIYGKEINNSVSCGGVRGDFYYQNDTLYGLGDDIANNTMDSTDAIAVIEGYINNLNEFDLSFEYESLLNPVTIYAPLSNVFLQFFLTYTTPCDTFSTSLTDNINVCKGAQAQLNATGGIAYEWLPQVGLSCYNCPNPVVTADTINYYTCRIWNTDSCSKVLPVKINILPLPSMPTIAVNPTLCSGNTGHIHITNQPAAYTYTLDGGTPQTTLHFTNLSAGNHLLTIQAANGCSIDTLLTVAEINNVIAQFTASPTSGDVPLSVNFTNQSANATNYSWYIEDDTLTTPQANHTFDTSGVFTVTLVAYNTFPQCSDTATVTIVAEYPFTIIAPSLYVSDENYTPYQIYTSGVTELHYELFTDQGKLVYNKVLLPTAGTVSLWNSTQLAKGIYLYRIWVVDDDGVEKVITGKVVVI